MNLICGLRYFEVEIDRFGDVAGPLWADRIVPAEHLFAICHGWNSNKNGARDLYERFFNQFCRTLRAWGAPGVTADQCAVMGILWPSEKYADPELTPGGAAGVSLRRTCTYRVMKQRAGIVGSGGLAPVLERLNTRLHLVGHSFGARVITAAAAASSAPVASMTLLQAAFSHNSFSPEGEFRNVLLDQKCAGPILITHSVHDEALGFSYPIISRILRQNASGLGGINDLYGALGRNGALHTPQACFSDLLPEGSPYEFSAGRIFNLRADDVIRSHTDIVKPEVAWALITAAGLGRS